MTTAELIIAIIIFLVAAITAIISIRSFMERGFPVNNAYIFASHKEREEMDKKPYYRQTAITFCLISVMFIVIGLSIVMQCYELEYLVIPIICATIVYAVVSSIKIGQR